MKARRTPERRLAEIWARGSDEKAKNQAVAKDINDKIGILLMRCSQPMIQRKDHMPL